MAVFRNMKSTVSALFTMGAVYSNAFNPRELKGLADWKRGDLGITFGIAPAIASVADLSGNGNVWAQVVVAAQPTQAAHASFNGQMGFTFDGIQQYLTTATPALGATSSFLLVSFPSTVGNSYAMGGTGNTLAFHSQIVDRFHWLNLADSNSLLAPFGANLVMTVRQSDGVSLVGRTNGVVVFNVVPASALNTRAFLSAGAAILGGSWFGGPIMEWVIYSVVLSTTDNHRLERYAGLRYQIAVA